MRKWWKNMGVLTGGLVGLGGLLSPAHAQFVPGPSGPGGSGGPGMPISGMFAGDPQPAPGADFPNAAPPSTEPKSPFELTSDGPNAFTSDAPPGPRGYRFSLRAEYLNWWFPSVGIPVPLVTTSKAPNIQSDFGQLGQPNTEILLGGDSFSYGNVPGGRITMGLAVGLIPPIEVSGLSFNRNMTIFNQTSDGSANAPVLARPVNLLNQTNIIGAPVGSAYLVAFPGLGGGTIGVQSHLNLWAFDIDMFIPLADNGTIQLDFLFGFKHAEFNETLNIGENYLIPGANFNNIPGGTPNGFITSVLDNFAAGNRNRLNYSALSLITDARLSLGSTQEVMSVTGISTLTGAGASQSLPGGILALNSNGGLNTHNTFTALPELSVTLSCQLTNNVRIFAGYNLLYWPTVVRPADQLDMRIDPRQVPTDQTFIPGFHGQGPQTTFNSTSFFANGFTVGVEFGF
jgi:Putative beta barrel porin-7 (BBP7)